MKVLDAKRTDSPTKNKRNSILYVPSILIKANPKGHTVN